MIRRLTDTMDMLERECDVSGITSLHAYVESLETKFDIDFAD